MLSTERADVVALEQVLAEARATENVEVQVFALDALASLAGDADQTHALLDESDLLAPQVAHAVDEIDRVDAAAARSRWGI